MDINLSHKVNFVPKVQLYRNMSIALFLISVISILLTMFSPSNSHLFDVSFGIAILSICLLVAFLILYFSGKIRLKNTGSFEAIDIVENKIIYTSEKKGEKVFSSDTIESMSIYKNTYHTDDIHYNVKIKEKESDKVFIVPRWVSNYRGLIKKMRDFKQSNNISG